MTRSLFIAPQWIGDAVMSEPLLRSLHMRGEVVTVAALPWVAPVFRAMSAVAAVIELPFQHGGLQWSARRAMARQLHGQFARAYVAPNSLKSALLPWWAGIPVRVGYQGEARWGVLNRRLPNPPRDQRPPMVGHYLALAQVDAPASADTAGAGDWASSVLGATSFQPGTADAPAMGLRAPRVDPRPRLQRSPAQVQATLKSLGLAAQSYVVMVPGAEYGPAKRWPATHFSALARSLHLPTVLIGSAKEAALCDTIAAPVNAMQADKVRNLAGQTDLLTAMDVIASARAVVSNDSGLMHVAAAFGVAQVALFGSSSPEHTPPLNPQAQVLWLAREAAYAPALSCAPCFERACPLGHTRCLNDISPERVRSVMGL